jgi:hypothetical protein
LAKTAKPLTDSKIIKSWIPDVDQVMCPKFIKTVNFSVNATANIIDGISQNVVTPTQKRCPKLTPTP